MREEYDFSNAKRGNPYIEKILMHGYAIVVNCGAAQDSSKDGDNDVPSANSVAELKSDFKRTSAP